MQEWAFSAMSVQTVSIGNTQNPFPAKSIINNLKTCLKMSTKKKGMLTTANDWAKHLRKWGKRFFWKKERLAERKLIVKEKHQTYIERP